MNDKKISVIVPIYNVERYLDKCIESIVNQTYTNLEIILVDDGSTDTSPTICDKWAMIDSRIRVIHQKNSGGGAARNTGLDAATGSIIAFVDSDDYISQDMYEHLYCLLELGADIAECDYSIAYDDNAIFDKNKSDFSFYTQQEAMNEHIRNNIFQQVIWNKLYKKDIVNSIRFPVDSKIDDEFFTYKVIGNATKLIHSKNNCYAYRQQDTSIMHTINVEQCLEAIIAKELRHDYICLHFPELKNASLINLWFSAIYIGQKALSESANINPKKVFNKLNTILSNNNIKISANMGINAIWILLAKCSLKTVCRIRNFLRIGL